MGRYRCSDSVYRFILDRFRNFSIGTPPVKCEIIRVRIVSKHSACSNVYMIQCLRHISVVLWLGYVPQLCQAIGTGHTIGLLVAC